MRWVSFRGIRLYEFGMVGMDAMGLIEGLGGARSRTCVAGEVCQCDEMLSRSSCVSGGASLALGHSCLSATTDHTCLLLYYWDY